MAETFYIGRVAADTGLSVHAIRFYERQGLLKAPLRSQGRFRIFSSQEVRDLKFIRRAQELGFSLTEIRELLVLRRTRPQACAHVRDLLTKALGRVEEKVADLARLRRELRTSLRKCNRDLKRSPARAERTCPVLEQLDLGRAEAVKSQPSIPRSPLEKRSPKSS
jgi:DNA-binding transcriptional MerR regulator